MPNPKFNIVIIGSGNMANALGKLFSSKHNIAQVISRNKKTGAALAKKLKSVYSHSIKEINTQADFYFLCVPDDAISIISKKIKHLTGTIVHHSGSKPLEEIKTNLSRAVIYPFLSINKETILNQKETTVFFQSNSKSTDFLLKQLLNTYKFKPQHINNISRAQLHLAAVLINNFTNHLYYKGSELVKGISNADRLLLKLANQSFVNLKNGNTKENQTGPARRNDKKTLKNHLNLIKKDKELAKIYLSLSQSITKTYTHE